jgi:hypothetical protein
MHFILLMLREYKLELSEKCGRKEGKKGSVWPVSASIENTDHDYRLNFYDAPQLRSEHLTVVTDASPRL